MPLFFRCLWICFVSIFFGAGCKHAGNSAKQVKDNNLTLQVMRLNEPGTDTDITTYKACIIPNKNLLSEKTTEEKNALWYKMDSCFYMQLGKRKIYASLTQPIANGIKGVYEYLLEFEGNEKDNKEWAFVYSDKFLDHHIHSIQVNKNTP